MNLSINQAYADSMRFPLFGATALAPLHRYDHAVEKSSIIQAYLFGDIINGLVVVQPLQINIEQDEDHTFVVDDDVFLVYGNGTDQSEAINDYVISMIEYYRLLEKNAATNPFDQRQFSYLQTYIKPKTQRGYNAIQADRD